MTWAATAVGVAGAAAGAAAGSSGGKGGGSSQPPPPDPYQQADAQFGLNKRTANYAAQLNRYTQNNPFGQVRWTNSGTQDNPQWTQNTALSPEQQRLYDTQLGTQNLSAQGAQSNFGNLMTAIGNGAPTPDNATFNQVKDALFQQLQPGLDHTRQMTETKLANMGLNPGGEAYTNAMRDVGNQENNAYLNATTNAMNQMAQEQGMANAFQNQAITNQGALNQFSGKVNIPTYNGSTTIDSGTAPDIASMMNNQYQAQVANHNIQQAGKNSATSSGLGALGTIAAAAI